ncbi:restriction endonuclease subunit S [Fictibacillus sp. 18YEL24]|uniref:restriction endonuclease subunit S n=1 Tax=Fictibacillus sp. 18YEL24 TaxID=2745875 RepID=UPI0018CCCC9C|nr:restriction endonuclease subunit S [Fictibacillus sp. 18YEL24]MBH0171500.1 restriction endonuclease subunit S [Fictibacillus sp. 18YEL24]
MTEQTSNLIPKRRFKEFKNSLTWEQQKLGEVADIIGGGTPSTSNKEYWNGDINWYSPVEIGEQTYVDNSQKKITELGLQKCSAKILPIGTVLFTSRAGIGNTAILANEGATNQGFQSIVPHKGELDSYFIYSRTHELKRYGETNGAGSTFVEVSGKQMAKMPMLFPALEEQKKIGGFFERLDDLIALHQRKLEKTKALKSAYLSELFPAEGEDKPKRRFAGFTQAWEQRKFDEEVEFYSGLTYSPKEVNKSGTFVLRSSNVKNGEIVDADNVYVNSEIVNSSNVKEGDIIVVVRNGSRSLIGKHAKIKKVMDKTVIGAFMTGIRSQQSNFINALLDTHAFKAEVDKNLGATINQITNGMFRDMQFTFPDSEEQKKIGNFFNQLDQLITLHERKVKKLQNLKRAYLHEMFV